MGRGQVGVSDLHNRSRERHKAHHKHANNIKVFLGYENDRDYDDTNKHQSRSGICLGVENW